LPAWTEFVKSAVEQRPELGGEQFDRPIGITTVEIDPETGMLATPSCPQRERVAVTSNFVTRAECYKHGQMFETVASSDGTLYTEPTVVYADQSEQSTATTNAAARSDSIKQRTLPPPRPPTTSTETPYSSYPDTRVETVRGRQTLVNDMRARP
jgi:hypothetical protein